MNTFKDDLSIVLCGEAGQGINTVEAVLVKLLKLAGYNVFASKEYMSRVRGGSNSTQIRVSSRRVCAPLDRIDIFIPLDKEAVSHAEKQFSADTLIVGDKSEIKTEKEIYDIPFLKLSSDLGNPVYSNIIAVGVLAGICGIGLEALESYLSVYFKHKGEDIVSKNIQAAKAGYVEGKKIIGSGRINVDIKTNEQVSKEIILNGAEAVALGAVNGGCNFLSSYPMSPSTGVLTFISENAKRFGVVTEQAEDEIAAMNMTLGAWYAGARGMVTTSGGGFALMTEGISLAGITETPVVVHLAQRPGPATGLPTRTEQADLEMVLYSGHGEFPRIIYAPGNLEDAFYLTQIAFNMADKFQVPVFVLTDQYLMDSYYNLPGFDLDKIKNEYYVVKTEKDYKRYLTTVHGVSPRGIPGNGEGMVCVDSDEHDENGRITEDLNIRVMMEDKRRLKLKNITRETLVPEFFGAEKYDTMVLCWGSTCEIVKEALRKMGSDKIAMLHFKQVYPVSAKINEFLYRAKKVVIVENNATAQFAKIIQLETNFKIENKITKYNGLPFTVEELANELGKVI